MHCLARLLTAVMLLAAASTAAFADAKPGTHAWSTHALTLRSGPGSGHDATGTIGEDLAIRVLRCHYTWCLVEGDTGRGWTGIGAINFGKVSPPNYATGGTACFYSGTHYSGAEYCYSSGQVVRDLAAVGLDNSFASVRIEGTNVAVCRERSLQYYCERIVQSQPVLPQYLNRNVSSLRVY